MGRFAKRPYLRPQYPPPRILNAFPQRNQPQKQLPRRFLPGRVEASEDLIRSPAEGAGHPAYLLVGCLGHHPILAAIEQFGQGILQQRQTARLFADVGHNGLGQSRLQAYAHTPGRFTDRPAQLFGRHG